MAPWGKILAFLGLVAAVITIFVFFTGITNIYDAVAFFSNNFELPQATSDRASPTFTPSPTARSVPVPTTKVPSTPTQTPIPLPTRTPTPSPTPKPTEVPVWEQLGFFEGWPISDIVLPDENTIFIAFYEGGHGIVKSIDIGENWTSANNGLGDLDVYNIAVAPNNGQRIYARTKNLVLWKTSDGGQTWIPMQMAYEIGCYSEPFSPLAVVSGDGTQLYFGDCQPSQLTAHIYGNVIINTDSGQVERGPSDSSLMGMRARVFEVAGEPSLLWGLGRKDINYFGSGQNHPYKSEDGGITWWKAASVGSQYDVRAIGSVGSQPNVVYAGTSEHGLYKSTDGGGLWVPVNTTLPKQGAGLLVQAIAADPRNIGQVYASIYQQGIAYSADAGETWEIDREPNIKNTMVTTMVLSPDSVYLYVGTEKSGLWRRKLLSPSPTPTHTSQPSAAPTMTSASTSNPSPTPLPSTLGKWENQDPNTANIARIIIDYNGQAFSVQVWGNCTPTDCYWNEMEGSSYDVSEVTETSMTINWTFWFVVRTLHLESLPDGRLRVTSHSHFTDNSGRDDYEDTEYFTKLED